MARLQRTSSQRPQPAGAPGRGHRLDAVVLVVPFLGVIAYHVLGRPRLPA